MPSPRPGVPPTLQAVIPAKAGTQCLLLLQPVSRTTSLGPGFRRDDGQGRPVADSSL